jgi:hypothetical protein
MFVHHVFQVETSSFWEALSAIGALTAALVALFGVRLWRYIDRPRISASFDKTSERCFRWVSGGALIIPNPGRSSTVTVEEGRKKWYFRLRVLNEGRLPVRGLKAKIELYDLESGNPVDRFEPSALNWITGSAKIDLAPNEEEYLNLLSQLEPEGSNDTLNIELADQKNYRGIAWKRELKAYRLRVAFHAQNLKAPVIKFFTFTPQQDGVGKLESS